MNYPLTIKYLEELLENLVANVPYEINGSVIQTLLTKDVNSIVTDIFSSDDVANICNAISAGQPIKICLDNQVIMVNMAYYSEIASEGYQSILLEFYIKNSSNVQLVKLELESISNVVRLSTKSVGNV